MQIVRDVAGYSLGRSDLVRRAMAKKKKSVMEEEKEYFIHGLEKDGQLIVPGAVRNGVPESVAEQLFDEMSSFASYAFNKSHAAAYGVVAVQTAYLKCHHTAPFMAALMNSVIGNEDKISQYIQYCRKHGIDVLPPSVNTSKAGFSVEMVNGKPAIRFGLNAVKTVGRPCVDAIVSNREVKGLYRDLFDFCERITAPRRSADGKTEPTAVNKRAVEALIKAGAFDHMVVNGAEVNRAQWLDVYERAMDASSAKRKQQVEGQLSLFDALPGLELPMPELPVLAAPPLRALLNMEKENTGVYISGHPLDEYRSTLEQLPFTIQELKDLGKEEEAEQRYDQLRVTLGGIISASNTKITRSGGMMAFMTLEDMTATVECLVFPKVLEQYAGMVSTDRLVRVSGKLSLREDEDAKVLVDAICDIADELPQTGMRGLRGGYGGAYDGGMNYGGADSAPHPDLPPIDAAPDYPASPAISMSPQPEPVMTPPRKARSYAASGAAITVGDGVIAPAEVLASDEAIIRRRLEAARNRVKATAAPAPDVKLYIRIAERAQIEDALALIPRGADVPVYVHIASENATLLAPQEYWTHAEADLTTVCAQLGAANVKLVKR